MRQEQNLEKLTFFLKINERIAHSVGYSYFVILLQKFSENIFKCVKLKRFFFCLNGSDFFFSKSGINDPDLQNYIVGRRVSPSNRSTARHPFHPITLYKYVRTVQYLIFSSEQTPYPGNLLFDKKLYHQ